jgi:PAS domain S-box-containing protein
VGEQHLIDRESRRLADFVREHSAQILDDWEARVRGLRPAAWLDRPVLLDHMPQFLDDIAAYVDEVRAGHEAKPSKSSPRAHAIDRLELGYDITEVVAEYKVLRECLLDLAVRELAPAVRSAEMPRLHAAIDLAIAESVVRYTTARERTLKALDRISEAALDQADVVGFLDKLLSVLSETTEAVDLVKIMLREGDELVLRAAVGPIGKETVGRFRLRIGEGFAGRIAVERRPILLAVASADPGIENETLRGQRAVYGIPLIFRDELVGVALMGSATAFQFSEEDKLLFRTMAARATGIIVQGQLLQREKAAQRRFRSVVEASADIIWTRDADGQVVESSPGWSAFTGQSLDDQRGPGWLEAIHPEDREQVRRAWIATVKSRRPWSSEYRLRRKSGDYAEVISRGVPVMADGAVQEWVGTVSDVTRSRMAERALRESEKRTSAIVQSLH